ncbi:hypothetical protein C7E13_07070 [Stenotrophomonas maltophilia]|uniref:hypothetical protein n=2 Tax=Lysobacteraceae TaxID=32033 RepID=UPI000D400C70|nr:hypothetical protein [Stenotrophomonas maltophilia]MCO7489487.1 hypothetical protein [Stenotrophomonas maltophilia]PSD24079.1 hypothetical protein C7E13_07070 [Stenotrophomonas maltophilia]PZT18266.1 hypothetical protein A7X86_11900 [Stenotrophomonas maltophilia]
MKCATRLLLLLAIGLLAACDALPHARGYTYPNDRYLEENVAKWNSMVETINTWNDGPWADEFYGAINNGDDLSKFQYRLQVAHKNAVERRAAAERMTHRSEAADLHRHLLISLQSVEDMFSIMVALAELPDGYTPEQSASLLARLEPAIERMDTDLQRLSDAQDAFAKSEQIQLTTRDPTHH